MLVSYHRTQLVALNEDEPDFGAWRRSLEGRLPTGTDPLDPKLLDYPSVGRVGAALGRLLEHVDLERLHVVVFDDLVTDPEATWGQSRRSSGFPRLRGRPSRSAT